MMRKRLAIFIMVTLVLAGSAVAADLSRASGLVRLHDEVAAEGPTVTLGEVAEITGPDAAALSALAIADLPDGGDRVTVSRAQVSKILTDAGVNWGRLSLCGYLTCEVGRDVARPVLLGENATPAAASNPTDEITTASALTLREKLIRFVERFAGVPRQDLRITFDDRDAEVLARAAVTDRYEFEPMATAARGRLPLVVRRYVGEKLVETFNLSVDVARRYLAVAAARNVSRGQTFAPGDVEVCEVYLDDVRGEPVTDLKEVIGQTAGAQLRAGAVLYAANVRSPLLVRRGDTITVRCVSGGLVLKTVARAEADGAESELIEARNERSRQVFTVRVTGLREAQVVTGDGATEVGS